MNNEKTNKLDLRGKAEKENKNSKEWDRTFNSISDFIFLIDTERNITKVNKSFCDALKLKPEDIIGKKCYKICHKSDTPCPGCPVERVYKTKKPASAEVYDINIGLLFFISVSPIFNDNNELTGAVHIAKDITKRKQAEKNLKDSEHKLSTMFNSMLDGVLIADSKTKQFSFGNKSIYKMLGYNEEEIKGLSIMDIHPEEALPHVIKQFEKQLSGEIEVAMNLPVQRKNGSVFYADITSAPLIISEKTCLLGIFHDITKRKKIERMLKNSNEYFASIVSNIPGIAYRCALDEKWTMNFLSEYTVNLTGFPSSDFIGNAVRTYESIIHREDTEYVTQIVHKAVESNKAWEIEYRINNKDGSIRWVFEKGNAIYDPVGKVEFLQGVVLDITDRKKYEELSLQTQKIEAIGTFAGGIAHDFNNIMMGVFGNISLAKIKLSKDHPILHYLEESEQSMSRAKQLTGQLLTFATGGEPIKKDIKISQLIEEVVTFDLSGSNVKLVFEYSKDLWLAKVDKGQIQQVFSNLTINANQAMSAGGQLYITLENADIKEDTVPGLNQGKYIKATVQDEGVGIKNKNLGRIFEPFFTTKELGRGLGLATTYSVIKRHGGVLSVVSELGKGTTFTLYLPASETQLNSKAKIAEYSTIIQTARILLMDDDKNICNFLTELLEEYGFSVSTAIEGEQAIEIYKQSLNDGEPFDAVIMDLTIPGGMGGKEAVKKILNIDPKAKCIISSGYANDPVMSNYAEYGFKENMTKPYFPNKLLEILNKVLKE